MARWFPKRVERMSSRPRGMPHKLHRILKVSALICIGGLRMSHLRPHTVTLAQSHLVCPPAPTFQYYPWWSRVCRSWRAKPSPMAPASGSNRNPASVRLMRSGGNMFPLNSTKWNSIVEQANAIGIYNGHDYRIADGCTIQVFFPTMITVDCISSSSVLLSFGRQKSLLKSLPQKCYLIYLCVCLCYSN